MAVKKFKLNPHDKMIAREARKQKTVTMKLKIGSLELIYHRKGQDRPQWYRVHGKLKQAKEIRL